jgi:hypothetical protein
MRRILLMAMLALAGASTAALPDPSKMDAATFDRELERYFQYGPPEPKPVEVEDIAQGQVADARYFRSFPDYDRSYSPTARAKARRLADRLVADAGNLSHEQFVLRVAEIAAVADNGHTTIGENAWRKNTPRVPLRTYLFADGLHVLWANPANADLIGARIDRIDGKDIAAIYGVIRRYQGGTESRRRVALLPVLESPALLRAAGIAAEREALTISGVLIDGSPFKRRVTAEPRDRAAWVSSTSRTLFPAPSGVDMKGFLQTGDVLPASLRNQRKLFTLEPLEQGGLYVGIGANNDSDDEPIEAFLANVLDRVRAERPGFLVVDMRMNGGGNYEKTYAFARALPGASPASMIYVLTSPWTFSAAITTVASLKDAGGNRVGIVGEEVGDRLDFWAEGNSFALPNAFLKVSYAAGRHRYDGPCDDMRECFWLNRRYPVRVRDLRPDVIAPWTFAAYRQRRDPALDAVFAEEARRKSKR